MVWFGGGNLAADLARPALLCRWDSSPAAEPVERTDDGRSTPAARRDVLEEAAAVVNAATEGSAPSRKTPPVSRTPPVR
jgi:hypothetical protein